MDVEDRKLLTPVTTYWATTLKQMFSSSRYEVSDKYADYRVLHSFKLAEIC